MCAIDILLGDNISPLAVNNVATTGEIVKPYGEANVSVMYGEFFAYTPITVICRVLFMCCSDDTKVCATLCVADDVRINKLSVGSRGEADVKGIFNVLSKHNKSGTISNSDHVQNIKNTQADIQNNICPRCQGALVVRNGKNGKFIGCSNYPKCKFTKQI